MLSEVQRRKFEALFRTLDNNGDGSLEWADFDSIVDNMAREVGAAPFSSEHTQIETDWRTFWVGFHQVAGRTDEGPISKDEFLAFNDVPVHDDAMYANLVRPLAEFAIDTFDTDGDGRISYDEMKAWYRCYRITDDAVVATEVRRSAVPFLGWSRHGTPVGELFARHAAEHPSPWARELAAATADIAGITTFFSPTTALPHERAQRDCSDYRLSDRHVPLSSGNGSPHMIPHCAPRCGEEIGVRAEFFRCGKIRP